jgi:hypothetical protein
MDRTPGSHSVARLTRIASIAAGLACSACAGTGPPVIEHPRSTAIVVVSPESDALVGAPTFRPGERVAQRTVVRRAIAPRLVIPARADVATLHASHVVIDVGEWNLALDADLSEEAVEEGAWQASRR